MIRRDFSSPLRYSQSAMETIDEMVAAAGTKTSYSLKRVPNKLRKRRPESSPNEEVTPASPQRRRTVMGELRGMLSRQSVEAKYAAIKTSSSNNSFKLKSMVRRSPDSPSSSHSGLGIGNTPSMRSNPVITGGSTSKDNSMLKPGDFATGNSLSQTFIVDDTDGPMPILASRRGVSRKGPPSPELELRDWALDRPAVSSSDFMPVLVRGDVMEAFGLRVDAPLPIYPRDPPREWYPEIKPIDPCRAWRNSDRRQRAKDELFTRKDPRDYFHDMPVPPRWGENGRVIRPGGSQKIDMANARAAENVLAAEEVIRADKMKPEVVLPGPSQRPVWNGTPSSSIFMGENLAEEWEKYVPYVKSEDKAHNEIEACGKVAMAAFSPAQAPKPVPIAPVPAGPIVELASPSRLGKPSKEAVQETVELDSQELHELDATPPVSKQESSHDEWRGSLSQRWKAARDDALAKLAKADYEVFQHPTELPASREELQSSDAEGTLHGNNSTETRLAEPGPLAELATAREDLRLSFAEEEPRNVGSIDARLAVPTPHFQEPPSTTDLADATNATDEPDLSTDKQTASREAILKGSVVVLADELAGGMQQRWDELIARSENASSGAHQWDTHV
ncbi:hypothetical protein LTR78_006035 [Recurvomyces mirabilis]|uniref:Uncharacterized protein n=1 Tax=Recurvomyces mirabilis TaxID=574656 RepID=A0AAE0WM11_9PEZI|nr:hypothetical protein LTR78_006035 [Recurvomyces mirabilis]KAK5155154.1 hypothetical protein LTS14_006109 [Recurvomyces mirabilis]